MAGQRPHCAHGMPHRHPQARAGVCFHPNGSFSSTTYMARVGGFFLAVMDSGRCFSMVVAFSSDERDACYYVGYAPQPSYSRASPKCPSKARKQHVPMFLAVDKGYHRLIVGVDEALDHPFLRRELSPKLRSVGYPTRISQTWASGCCSRRPLAAERAVSATA